MGFLLFRCFGWVGALVWVWVAGFASFGVFWVFGYGWRWQGVLECLLLLLELLYKLEWEVFDHEVLCGWVAVEVVAESNFEGYGLLSVHVVNNGNILRKKVKNAKNFKMLKK